MCSDDVRLSRALGWVLVGCLAVAELYRRVSGGAVPPDFSAYLAAADVWLAGGDPYGEALLEAGRYRGYPYVYPPGTLPITGVLGHLSTAVATSAEWLVRCAVLAWLVAWLHRTFDLDPPLFALLPLLFLYEPLAADMLGGNLTTYLLAVVLACHELGRREPRRWRAAVGLPLGVLLACKPMWGLPVLWLLLCHRAWYLGAGLVAGGTVVAGLTLEHWHLVDDWLVRIEEVRRHYQSVDLLSLGRWLRTSELVPGLWSPLLPAIATLLWAAVGWHLLRAEVPGEGEVSAEATVRYTDDPPPETEGVDAEGPDGDSGDADAPTDTRGESPLWLWGCTSLLAWPRLGSYSYVLLLPVLAFLWQRWGRRRLFPLLLPVLGPIPWLLKAHRHGLYYRGLLYLWGLAVTVALAVELKRAPE